MKKQIRGVLFTGLALLVLWIPGICRADVAAVLISMKGSVLISANGTDDWIPAESGMSIPEGYFIKVEDDAEAALMLTDRSQIRLRDNSVLCLKKSGSAPEDKVQQKGVLSFLKGRFWMRNKRKVIKPDINTASLNMSIRGTELQVTVDDITKETRVISLEGDILCENTNGSTVITRGTEAVAAPGKAIQTHRLINPEASVQWLLITPDVVGPADRFPKTPDERLALDLSRSAMRLLVENRVQAAYDKAFEALGLAPDMAAPNIAAATVLQTKGEFEAALARAQTGLAADPLSEPALLRVTELLLGLNRVREARQVMAGFTGAKSGRFHMTQGFLFLIGHDTARALTSFETALAMDRDLARAWVGLGLAQYAQGQIRPGLEKLETASLLDPLSAFPHNYLGKALYEVEEYEEAKTEFVRARQLDPNDPTPWLYLAILAQDHFAPAESMRHLKKAIDMNDNRFVSRSRFLLDMDRSVKNINLAKSLSDLGMNEWARHMGNRAIWEDPANSAAYLFRGAEALSLSRVDVSTLSDLKRAQLLNPVNSNTFPSYTDYYSLMELPEHIRILEGYAGTDDTFGSTFTARGGINRHSYRVSAHADTTDGPSDGTGSSDRYVDVQYKAEPVQNHQFMFGVQGGINEKEDLVPRQNGFARANDDVTDTGYHQINGGYHWRVSAGQDLLISLQYQYRDSDSVKNRQFELVPNVWYNWADFLVQKDERYRAEVIDLIRFQNHAVTLGGSLGRLDRDLDDVQTITPASSPGTIVSQLTSDAGPRETEVRVFARDLWSVTDALTLDLGMGWCRFDSDSKDDRTRFLPQAGAMLALGKENLVRAAFYREIQPDYLSATLQPVEVAGFSSITGDPSGTLTSAWGLAFDRQWGSRYFTSIEAGFKEKEYNTAYLPHPGLAKSWNSEDTSFLGLTLNYLISEHYALSLTQRFTEIEPDVPGLDRKDSETGVRLTGVYPFGLTLQTAWWFVDQDFDDAGAAGMDGDRFVIGSLSARQRLFNKKMELFLRLDNILDQSFNYVPEESITGLDLPWQGAFFLAGFRVTF